MVFILKIELVYHRYQPNDFYLKQLIEEWCEGVIQGNYLNEEEFSSSNTDIVRPQSLLLEKVAEHLQKHVAESLSIDVQGLTKVYVALSVSFNSTIDTVAFDINTNRELELRMCCIQLRTSH